MRDEDEVDRRCSPVMQQLVFKNSRSSADDERSDESPMQHILEYSLQGREKLWH